MLPFATLLLGAMALNAAMPANSGALARHHSPIAAARLPAVMRAPPITIRHLPVRSRISASSCTGMPAPNKAVLVSVGIPFAPGVLSDPRMLRILDAHGAEVPAAVRTTLNVVLQGR